MAHASRSLIPGALIPGALIPWALLGAVTLGSCGGGSGEARRFEAPASLADMLSACGADGISDECVFQVTDAARKPVPFALLRMDWPDLGRLSFQTDIEGSIVMRIPKETDITDVLVRVERKPDNQDLLAESYEDSTQPIAGGGILMTVR